MYYSSHILYFFISRFGSFFYIFHFSLYLYFPLSFEQVKHIYNSCFNIFIYNFMITHVWIYSLLIKFSPCYDSMIRFLCTSSNFSFDTTHYVIFLHCDASYQMSGNCCFIYSGVFSSLR